MYTSNEKLRNSEDFKNINSVLQKLRTIEEKNRCVRVRFLDWLSEKLAAWSIKVKQTSDNIHTPCKIKID